MNLEAKIQAKENQIKDVEECLSRKGKTKDEFGESMDDKNISQVMYRCLPDDTQTAAQNPS